MSEWQPIETAPKNKKLIVGYANALGKWRTIIARHYPPSVIELGEDAEEFGFAPEGWYEETETHENIMACETPTHWMPLPAPPKEPAP